MFFENRPVQVAEITDAAELADKLTNYSWTLCTAFRFGDLLFVNDATSEDGAQEYAVLRKHDSGWVQIESLTASWMDTSRMLECIDDLTREPTVWTFLPGVKTLKSHPAGSCRHCA